MKMKVTHAPEATGKIVTPYAKIFRSPSENGDYWSIRYLDPTDGEIHIGFSSFVRDNVEHWLKEEFEVYDCRDKITDIDAELGKALRKVTEILMQNIRKRYAQPLNWMVERRILILRKNRFAIMGDANKKSTNNRRIFVPAISIRSHSSIGRATAL